jgi:hypothetical protein
MKKVILEEIENMKYLLGYKRGVVISEQVEGGQSVLTNPAAGSTTPTTGAPTTGAPAAATTPVTPIKIGVENPSIKELQNTLNTKFQSTLDPDGKYGPQTAASILAALTKISTTNTAPANPVVGDPNSEVAKKTAEANASTNVAANNNTNNNTQQQSGGTNFTEVDGSEFS